YADAGTILQWLDDHRPTVDAGELVDIRKIGGGAVRRYRDTRGPGRLPHRLLVEEKFEIRPTAAPAAAFRAPRGGPPPGSLLQGEDRGRSTGPGDRVGERSSYRVEVGDIADGDTGGGAGRHRRTVQPGDDVGDADAAVVKIPLVERVTVLPAVQDHHVCAMG